MFPLFRKQVGPGRRTGFGSPSGSRRPLFMRHRVRLRRMSGCSINVGSACRHRAVQTSGHFYPLSPRYASENRGEPRFSMGLLFPRDHAHESRTGSAPIANAIVLLIAFHLETAEKVPQQAGLLRTGSCGGKPGFGNVETGDLKTTGGAEPSSAQLFRSKHRTIHTQG
jgi:hypothetical protein